MFSCKGLEYEYDDMDELIKAVPKPLYFFLIQNCCIIEALMMVILIDVKKKKGTSDLRHKLLRKLVVHFIFFDKMFTGG